LKEIPERCDFIINNEWGNLDDPLKFYKNIKNSLYGLCVRGGGNFSFRLGEVLMMGRIPILIDTDCILPFPDLIPYDTNFIRIPIEKIDDMVNIIEKYHESKGDDVKVVIIPDIESVNYGRGVGYEVIYHHPTWEIAKISGTKIRNGEIDEYGNSKETST
jgi:hypothetical protein